MLHNVITYVYAIIGALVLYTISQDNRVQNPYKTILMLLWIGLLILVAWYGKTHFNWW